jgi:5-methylcytosine-specific restriction endonuclease McrA
MSKNCVILLDGHMILIGIGYNLHIHHVIPREYGGDNSFDNLYPLPRDIHQQVVTPWWVNY